MAHKNLQVICLFLLISAFSVLLSTVIYDSGKHWREFGLQGEAVESVVKYDGLFIKCSFFPTGQEECGSLNSDNVPEFTKLCRVLVLISLASLIMAFIAHLIGSATTVCLYKESNSTKKKAKIIMFTAVVTFIVSIFIIVAGATYSMGVSNARETDLRNYQAAEIGGNIGSYMTGRSVSMLWVTLVICIVHTGVAVLSVWEDLKKEDNVDEFANNLIREI